MKHARLFSVILVLVLTSALHAQLITTGETNGKGKTQVIASANSTRYLGSNSSGGYMWLGYGVNDRIDAFTIDGWTNFQGETQYWGGVGANTHLGKVLGADVSTYDYLTIPLTKRSGASTVLVDLSLVFSRHFGPVVGYAGGNAVIPIGKTYQSTFTPPKTEFQVPVGIAIPVGRWGFYGEADLGRLRTMAVGLTYTR